MYLCTNVSNMTTMLGNTRRPDVSFYATGRIDITARTAKLLALRDGDVIDIATNGKEYYLYVKYKGDEVVGRHEAQCRPTKKGSRNYRAYSRRLCSIVLDLNGEANAAHLPVGEAESGGKMLPIIIRNNIKKL